MWTFHSKTGIQLPLFWEGWLQTGSTLFLKYNCIPQHNDFPLFEWRVLTKPWKTAPGPKICGQWCHTYLWHIVKVLKSTFFPLSFYWVCGLSLVCGVWDSKWNFSLLTMRGRVLIRAFITSISTPDREQAEGQRPTSSWEEAWAVMPQGKVRTHHLHTEQNTYRSRRGGAGNNRNNWDECKEVTLDKTEKRSTN